MASRKKAEPSASGGNAADSPPSVVSPMQTSALAVPHADLVLHPDLQCRAKGLDPEVVKDYAAAFKAGAEFPPIAVIKVDDKLYVVDGWHREAASRAAGLTAITAIIVPGTWRDAVLAAAKANGKHGLRRTQEDKRRAVRLALTDPEIAALSSRKVAEAVGVSHTFVDEERKRYGLTVGAALTEDVRKRMDGEPTEDWLALVGGVEEKWAVTRILNTVRRAPTVDALARTLRTEQLHGAGHPKVLEAIEKRLGEFASDDMTWADDEDEALLVVRQADNEEDIARCLATRDCPEAITLLQVLADLPYLTEEYGYTHFDKLRTRWKNREGLLSRLDDAESDRKKAVESQDWYQLEQVYKLRDDVERQRAAFGALPSDLQVKAQPVNLHRDLRDHEYRIVVENAVGHTEDCADPLCEGWGVGQPHRCIVCRKTASEVMTTIRGVLKHAGRLVTVPGYGIKADTDRPVVFDAPTVELVAELEQEMHDGEPAWLAKVPAAVRNALRSWASRTRPTVTGDATEAQQGKAIP